MSDLLRTDEVLKQINELSPEVLKAQSAHFNTLRFVANSHKDTRSLDEFNRAIEAINQRLAGETVVVHRQTSAPIPPANEPKRNQTAALDPLDRKSTRLNSSHAN